MKLKAKDAGLAGRLALAIVLGLAWAPAARADGGGGGGGSSAPDPTKCGSGEYFSDRSGKCEKLRAGALDDKDLAQYAFLLAKAGRYGEAIAALDLLRNPDTAVALNYRGYATRQMGKVDEGIGYYLRSVRLDPRYAQVREYLGEAYVIKGDLPSARQQLAKIRAICGNTGCDEYEHLAAAIADGPNACGSRYAARRCAAPE
ncbi:MAG TPA: tetratricopeptide repeat protein [Stellaceae bacterium]|nr:tetratricopeptide repeat protein [Stellaceae bacterium]